MMREVGQNLGIPLSVFGPETHMTAIVGMALGKREVPSAAPSASSTASFMLPGAVSFLLLVIFLGACEQCFVVSSSPILLELDNLTRGERAKCHGK